MEPEKFRMAEVGSYVFGSLSIFEGITDSSNRLLPIIGGLGLIALGTFFHRAADIRGAHYKPPEQNNETHSIEE